MFLPKIPVVFRAPVDPNAKKRPSNQPKCVTSGWLATREFQEDSQNLKCHAFPRGKSRCEKRCTPSHFQLQRASQVINGQSLPYSVDEATAVLYALLCPIHWDKTTFHQTLFHDLILYQSTDSLETRSHSDPNQELQLILAPRPPNERPPLENFLAFSCNQLRRACRHLDKEQEDDTCRNLARILPQSDTNTLVLRAESRLRVARERWESSPSSRTSWRGPAHLDYSVARTTLAFDHENEFRCIAYEADQLRCEHALSPDEVATVRDAFGYEFTSYLPPQLLELSIPPLLCPKHRNSYWKHAYYQRWALSLVDDEDSLPTSPLLDTETQDLNPGHRRTNTDSTFSKDQFLSGELAHGSGEMVLHSSRVRPDLLASENEVDKAESEQVLESDDGVANCLTSLTISGLGKPSGDEAQPSHETPSWKPDGATGNSYLSSPTTKLPSSPSSQKPSGSKSSGIFDSTSWKTTEFSFGFQSLHFRKENNTSRVTPEHQSRSQESTSLPEHPNVSLTPSVQPTSPETYRTAYHTFDDDARGKLLADDSHLLSDLERIQQGLGVVPSSVRAFCKTQRQGSKLEPKNFSASHIAGEKTWGAMEQNVYEWCRVCDLHAAASECALHKLFEAAWNAEVHSTVLRLALGRRREEAGVWYQDITTAGLCSWPFATGTNGKKVDYAVVLEPGDDLKTRIRDKLERSFARSINHTAQEHVRYQPIAISIETKRPDEHKTQAEGQLLVWVSGHFTRLRQLLGQSTKKGPQKIPALPLLLVQGHEWKLYMAKVVENPSERKLDLFQEMTIGSTASVLGIYTLVAALRRLAEWAEKVYQPWFVESILDE